MKQVIAGLAIVIIGLAFTIYRKQFVEISVGYQIWAFRMPFGKRMITFGYWFVLIFGLLMILVGILTLLGVITVK